jgi:hypothetical protein
MKAPCARETLLALALESGCRVLTARFGVPAALENPELGSRVEGTIFQSFRVIQGDDRILRTVNQRFEPLRRRRLSTGSADVRATVGVGIPGASPETRDS